MLPKYSWMQILEYASRKLKLKRKKNWGEKEILYLKKNYCVATKEQILDGLFNRSWMGIRSFANDVLKLKRKNRYLSQEVFTQSEILYLQKSFASAPKKELLGNLPNYSWHIITRYSNKILGIERESCLSPKIWGKEEINYLKKNYITETKKKIMTNLPDRTWTAIQNAVQKLEIGGRNLKGIHLSPKSEWKKGHGTWNKRLFEPQTSIYNGLRGGQLNYDWRKEVFARDDYTCQECGVRDGKLHAHHKRPFHILLTEFLEKYNQFSPLEDKEILFKLAERHDPFWDLSNGKTLCQKCHGLVYKESVLPRSVVLEKVKITPILKTF